MVKIYSTPVCPYCTALKNFLQEHNIEFRDIDLSQNEDVKEEIIQKAGRMEVPILETNGEFVVGFDKEKISKLLDIN